MQKNISPSFPLALGIRAFCSGALAATLLLTGCQSSDPDPPDTNPDAEIILLNPVGGETLKAEDTLWVKWKLKGKGFQEVNAVDVQLSSDDGKTWKRYPGLIGSIDIKDAYWGNFPWKIQDSVLIQGQANSQCRIKVKQYDRTDINKTVVSQAFTVIPK